MHVTAEGKLVAQQVTAEDGKFDFLGLERAVHSVSAEGMEGSTKTPLDVDLDERPVAEVEVTLDAYRAIRGMVITPTGQPASGALLRISADGGSTWADLDADVEGRFDYSLPAGAADVTLLALTHSYPAALARIRPSGSDGPLTIPLHPQGGRLFVRGKGYVVARDTIAPFPLLLLPYEGMQLGAFLEPGSYSVCPAPALSDACRSVLVTAGANVGVDMLAPREKAGQ